MARRLQQMGVYPEKEIIQLSIPKILEILNKMDVLSDVSVQTLLNQRRNRFTPKQGFFNKRT